MGKEISIIIPCKDHIIALKKCIRGIYDNDFDDSRFEIIIVSSGENPGINDLVDEYPCLHIIVSKNQLPPGTARNLGSRSAIGEIFTFIDADCIPSKNWLRTISEAFSKQIVMVGGVMGTSNSGNILALSDNFIHFYLFSRYRPAGSANGLPGGNLSIRKDIFIKMNGFPDTRISEDWTLTQKIYQNWPKGSVFNPKIVVLHAGRDTFKSYFDHQYIHGYARGKNEIEITKKQRNLGRFFLFIPFVMAKRLISIYSKTFQYNKLIAILYLLLLPTVLFGLFSWTLGFRKGCKESYDSE